MNYMACIRTGKLRNTVKCTKPQILGIGSFTSTVINKGDLLMILTDKLNDEIGFITDYSMDLKMNVKLKRLDEKH